MLWTMFWMTRAADAAPSVAFRGQPECVRFANEVDGTVIINACDQPLLIDQAALAPGLPHTGLVLAGKSAAVSTQSDFVLGLGGALYRVVVIDEPQLMITTPASEQ